jgi:hypothetical protein
VFKKRNLAKVQDNLTHIINPTKKITELEKQLQFSKSFANQSALADAYLEAGMFEKAILNYEACLDGMFKNDFYVISKLCEAYYGNADYEQVVQTAKRIEKDAKYRKSRAFTCVALSNEQLGEATIAEEMLLTFDAPFSNYEERLTLLRFLKRHGKSDEAQNLLDELKVEISRMSKMSYKQNKEAVRAITLEGKQ